MKVAWLYLIMVVVGVVMFYYGAENVNQWLLIGFGMMFLGLLLMKEECEKELINRHKEIQDVMEE